ncbi:MAG TPA: hypothetical protein VEC37_06385 [Bacillota bacterium]|nr:hypothetical protein [Bacillota bacterium]
MNTSNLLICPSCQGQHFVLKYEAAYVYSYLIDTNAPGKHNNEEFLPFLYDNREQTKALQYLQCRDCGQKYPCYFNQWDQSIGVKVLQDAVKSPPTPDPLNFTVKHLK